MSLWTDPDEIYPKQFFFAGSAPVSLDIRTRVFIAGGRGVMMRVIWCVLLCGCFIFVFGVVPILVFTVAGFLQDVLSVPFFFLGCFFFLSECCCFFCLPRP